jgi:hypothetical protein
MNSAQLAASSKVSGKLEIADAPPLGPRLENASVTFYRVIQSLTVTDSNAARLFTVNILACLGCYDRRQRMPVIARCYQYRIDVVAPKHFVHITIHNAVFISVLRVSHVLDDFTPVGLNVTDRNKLNVRLIEHTAQYVPAPRTDADCTQHDPFTGSYSAVFAQGARTDDGRYGYGQPGFCDKISTRY